MVQDRAEWGGVTIFCLPVLMSAVLYNYLCFNKYTIEQKLISVRFGFSQRVVRLKESKFNYFIKNFEKKC